ncbi:dihydrolipoyl dehydrogenase family protein [Aquibaculum arenosum]|uniref:FAD-dependent oxidoreductase n=1 Tax=Aquibaculum arenosum TaxID=3032591 RepID=A0ABT5YRF0_9PROT|nr:FAD-dependent oxidoreductase [Fodinicurvata sp. CAU 1616]MDF2097493.1 FAD-dependent oxidoreductase [Fodinicurvata sp. CAU 1616]
MTRDRVDLCVVGAGSAGLTAAAAAARLGARVVLIERGRMGGDCLNYGCVPSKALLAAAARAAHGGNRLGVEIAQPAVDFSTVHAHVQAAIAAIAPHDSRERFQALGVEVLEAQARFTAPDRLKVSQIAEGTSPVLREIRARRFLLACGSQPLVPPIPGLAGTPYLTNETIFDLEELPEHLLILGGGPVGCELGQAFRRLGARVTLLQGRRLLPGEDEDAVLPLRQALQEEGVIVHEHSRVSRVEWSGAGIRLTSEDGKVVAGSHLLVAAGRQPSVAELGLEAAGIAHDTRGIRVDRRLRTSNRRVFAAGDVVSDASLGAGLRFTPVAGQQAALAFANALLRWPARFDVRTVPRVTYCDPEIARVGLSEAEARNSGRSFRVFTSPFAQNDRAVTEGDTRGFVKVIADRRGRILGCVIVGRGAGDLLHPWCLALAKGMNAGEMARLLLPYPTRGEAGKRAAGQYYERLLTGWRKALLRRLVRLG